MYKRAWTMLHFFMIPAEGWCDVVNIHSSKNDSNVSMPTYVSKATCRARTMDDGIVMTDTHCDANRGQVKWNNMQLHFALDVIRRGLEHMLPPEVVQQIKLSVAEEHYLMEKGANIETTGAELAREFEASMAAESTTPIESAVEMEAMDDATCIHMQLGAVEDTYEMTSVHFDVSVLEAC